MTQKHRANKSALITGSTDGIGKQVAIYLAGQGLEILLHGRNPEKGQRVREEIVGLTGNRNIRLFTAEFSSLADVRTLADDVAQQYDRLDILINNAGTIEDQRKLTPDGFEWTFAVNHLATFLLTLRLLPLLLNAPNGRIITVSARLHSQTIAFDNLQGEKSYQPIQAYALSKLSNILFTYELAERLQESSVSVNCLHPGVINTPLLRRVFGGGHGLPDHSQTLHYLAVSPHVANVTGQFFDNGRVAQSNTISYNPQIRQRLWQLSEGMAAPWL